MPPKTIKLGKKEDLASAIRQIKASKDREVIFELEKGSVLLSASENLRLMKKTGDVLGKKVYIQTDDELGQMLAQKAGVIRDDAVKLIKFKPQLRVAGSDIKPRFSDIVNNPKPKKTVVAQKSFEEQQPITQYQEVEEAIPRVNSSVTYRKPSSNFSRIFILSIVVLVILVFGLAVLLPQATVLVYARSEQVSRDLEITVDKNATAVDTDKLIIPGFLVSKEISQTKNFPATGSQVAGTKASGSVVFYNYTKNILTLRASTTTLVYGNQKFSLVHDATGIKPNGAANVPVAVMAQAAGDTYNLAANTRFQVVNSKLGNQNVYAINTDAFSGGGGTSTTIVSQQDIDNATTELQKEVLDQAQTQVSQERGEQDKLLASGVTETQLAKTANKNVGDAVDNFDMTVIYKVTGLAFRNDDVANTAIAKIKEVLSDDKYLEPDANNTYDANFKTIDQPNGKGDLAVHFETIAAYKVDVSNLNKVLAGKTESEIKEILLSKPEIDTVVVKFWPAWFVHRAPRFNGKVKINVLLSPNQ
jgi:hypothetical protein